jgi:Ca2+-binding RTX toxin-like protein
LDFVGTGNNDVFNGTQFADHFDMTQGGRDSVFGGRGDDVFTFGPALGPHDQINGGKGFDTLELAGGEPEITITSGMLDGIDAVELSGGHEYAFFVDAAPSRVFTIDGSELGGTERLYVYAGNLQRGNFIFIGGDDGDYLVAGGGNDTLRGGGGADQLEGRDGNDQFVYTDASDSTCAAFDLIVGFRAGRDSFVMPVPVTGVDPFVDGGFLDATDDATFNAELEVAIGSGQLAAGHAVAFDPDSGNWQVTQFLIVDANGEAGYQGGEDIVIRVAGGQAAFISLDNFDG